MPNVKMSIYIREEDVSKWKAIDNKAQWLHEHLNQFKPNEKIVYPASDQKPQWNKPISMAQHYCEHGQIKGECLSKEATKKGCNK